MISAVAQTRRSKEPPGRGVNRGRPQGPQRLWTGLIASSPVLPENLVRVAMRAHEERMRLIVCFRDQPQIRGALRKNIASRSCVHRIIVREHGLPQDRGHRGPAVGRRDPSGSHHRTLAGDCASRHPPATQTPRRGSAGRSSMGMRARWVSRDFRAVGDSSLEPFQPRSPLWVRSPACPVPRELAQTAGALETGRQNPARRSALPAPRTSGSCAAPRCVPGILTAWRVAGIL
jgi:hypothetical protein